MQSYAIPASASAVMARYGNIIFLDRPVHDGDLFSRRHPAMTRLNRAKIFAPFAALSGFDGHIQSKEVLYEPRRERDQNDVHRLGVILDWLHEKTITRRIARENRISAFVEFFSICSDPHNAAFGKMGTYSTETGIVTSVDMAERTITVNDRTIPTDDIYRISILRAS